jgi:hypothetical protein
MQWNRFLDCDPSHIWLRKMLLEIADAEPGRNMSTPMAAPAPAGQVLPLPRERKSA